MIICAAIKFFDKETQKEIVIPALRHPYVYLMLRDMGFTASQVRGSNARFQEIEQGFLNHKNEFLNRKDAYRHAKEIGQLTVSTLGRAIPDELMSEDII